MPSKIQSQMFRTVKSVKHARSKRIVQNGENQWSGMYYGAPVIGCYKSCTFPETCASCCGYGNPCSVVKSRNGQYVPVCT